MNQFTIIISHSCQRNSYHEPVGRFAGKDTSPYDHVIGSPAPLERRIPEEQSDVGGRCFRARSREKVLQFGEGGFLRGFVDWMIDGMNKQGLFAGSVVVIQPIAQGMVARLNEQNGAYTHMIRGVEGGKVMERKEVITSISRGINPYTDFAKFLKCAHNPDLRFIVSNTTEAGIAYSAHDKITDAPPSSFPAKLTLLLLERFKAFGGDPAKGFILLPCELIDNNGDNLKKTVLQTARNWNLDAPFVAWVERPTSLPTPWLTASTPAIPPMKPRPCSTPAAITTSSSIPPRSFISGSSSARHSWKASCHSTRPASMSSLPKA